MIKKLTILILLMKVSLIILLHAQVDADETIKVNRQLNRTILPELLTDKTLYQAGEKIRFSAFLYDYVNQKPADTSALLYLGLYNENGENLFSGRYPVKAGNTYGDISIPLDLPTGYYRIIAGTIQAFPEKFPLSVVEIPVINIYKPIEPSRLVILDEIQENEVQDSIILPNERTAAELTGNNLKLLTGKVRYLPKENVSITIKPTDSENSKGLSSLSLTVADSISTLAFNRKYLLYPDGSEESNKIIFQPLIKLSENYQLETTTDAIRRRGIMKKSPAENASLAENSLWVSVSTADQESEKVLMISRTDNASWFSTHWFSSDSEIKVELPEVSGNYPVVFQVFEDEMPIPFDIEAYQAKPEWRIPIKKPSAKDIREVINMTESIRKTAEFKAAYGLNESGIFHQSEKVEESDNFPELPFYSPPDVTIYTEDYDFSGSLEEFIRSYVSQLRVKSKKDKKEIRFNRIYQENINSSKEISLMLNGVPVTNISRVLELKTELIKRIEIKLNAFIYKDYYFDGIVSVFTHYPVQIKNFISDESMMKEVKGLTPRENIYSLIQLINNSHDQYQPDLRNLLYWHPDIRADNHELIRAEFTAPDMAGSYYIWLRGFRDGKVVNIFKKIRIY